MLAASNPAPFAYQWSILCPSNPFHVIWSNAGREPILQTWVTGHGPPRSSFVLAQRDERRSRRGELADCLGQASWTAGRLNKVHTVAQVASIGASEAMTDHSYRNVLPAAKSVELRSLLYGVLDMTWYNSRGANDNSTVAIPVMKVKFFGVGAPTFHIVPAAVGRFKCVNSRRPTPGSSRIVTATHRRTSSSVSIRFGDTSMPFSLILSPQEFWAGLIALSTVGLAYFGQDAIRDENSDQINVWRWGDTYRRPTKPSTWRTHLNCACLSIFFSFYSHRSSRVTRRQSPI